MHLKEKDKVTDWPHGSRGRYVQHVNVNAKSLESFNPAEILDWLYSQAFIREL